MIIGRLNKEMKEICLLDQVYVQDSDLTVAKYVDKVAKENNANLAVKKFIRFETGEGIEKKKRTLLRKLQNRWLETNLLTEERRSYSKGTQCGLSVIVSSFSDFVINVRMYIRKARESGSFKHLRICWQ